MPNATTKNTTRVGKLTKPQLSVDWTTTTGLTPFYVPHSKTTPVAHYAVAVETDVSEITSAFDPEDYKEAGVIKILKYHNKNTEDNRTRALGVAEIPQEASGTYVPLRPVEKIKVLVTIPDKKNDIRPAFVFEELPDEEKAKPTPFDEIQLNSFELSKKTKKIVEAIKKFAGEAKNFEGRIYNVDLSKEAERVQNLIPTLSDLIEANGFTFSEAQSDLILIGISGSGPGSSEYRPIYVQLDKGDGLEDLPKAFEQFRESDFTTSNTMYIYKNFASLDADSSTKATICGPAGPVPQGDPSKLDWQGFVEDYIHFPPVVIEHTTGRAESPEPKEELERQIREADGDSVKSPETLEKENWRVASQEFKKLADEKKKEAKDFIGDNVLANIGETLNTINKLEGLYDHLLDKLGVKYIIRASIRCLGIDLPIEELKAFLRDVNAFLGDIITILEIPTITLDDLIPTVDIMIGIRDQLVAAITEAVRKALTDMVKQIILTLLENCGDISKANFGGIPIGEAFKNGGLGGLVDSTKGVLGDAALGAALAGVKTGLRQTGAMPENARKFLQNLNTFVSNDTLQQLASENFSLVGEVIDQISTVLTPGELSKLLQGKAPPSVVRIINNVATGLADAVDAPPSAAIIKDLLNSPDKINDFFLNVAKVIDEDEILKQIEDFDKFTPALANGLCDLDDSLLRERLLSEKGLAPQEIKNQIDASRDRARNRINELGDLLAKDNILDGAIPPIYCTFKDGKIQPGLIDKDHESFSFMMKTMLNTMFDGVENSFGEDISRIPELLKIQSQAGTEKIERTKVSRQQGAVYVDGEFRIMNPEFEMAIKQGYQPPGGIVEAPPQDSDGDPVGDPDGSDIQRGIHKTIELNHGLPAIEKPIMENIFMPGLKQAYKKFQTSLANKTLSENTEARNALNVDNNVLQISIDNQLKSLLQQYGGDNALYQSLSLEMARDPQAAMTFGVDRYTLLCQQFADDAPGKDKFAIVIKAGSANIYKHLHNIDIGKPALNVIDTRQLSSNMFGTDWTVKEKYFANFLKKIWSQGENIYKLGSDDALLTPSYMRGFYSPPDESVEHALLVNQNSGERVGSLFEEYWRDLMATCLEIAGKNNYLLEGNFDLLDFNPRPTQNCPEPSLLGMAGIKEVILEMYKQVQCIESSLPNVTGLGDNRNNATEQASLYGVVKATVRTHVIEAVIKCLITFSRLMFEEADEAFIGYIRDKITNSVESLGYLGVFRVEALKAYNNASAANEMDSNVALDWFIKEELKYTVDLFMSLTGVDRRTTLIENYFIERGDFGGGLIPEFDVAGAPQNFFGTDERWQRVDESSRLKEYQVSSIQEIEGLKDWRTGNFYLERYIRADIDYSSTIAKAKFGFAELQPDDDTTYAGPTPVTSNGLFEGVTNPQQFPKWFYQEFSRMTIGQTTPAGMVEDPPTECAPDGPEVTWDAQTFDASVSDFRGKLRVYYKNLRYGLRLVCQVTQDGGVQGGLSQNNFFDIKEDVFPPHTVTHDRNKKIKLNKSYYIDESRLGGPEVFAFPIVCVEEDIPLDTDVGEILNTFSNRDDVGNFFTTGYYNAYRKSGGLVDKLKGTDEWAFIFDYCFPLKRLVSLAALYNITYLQPFPGLETVFINTKEKLRMAFVSLIHSGNYQYGDIDWTNKGMSMAALNQKIPGIDFGKMALMFLMALLKGAGETFSPNISIARKIQDASEIAIKAAAGLIADPSVICEAFTQRKPGESAEEQRSRCPPSPECPPEPLDLDVPILPISMALLPLDLFPPPPAGPGIGPPLGPLGYAYLFALPLFHELFKSEEDKIVERCNKKIESGIDFTKPRCPPSGSVVVGD